MLYYFDTSSIVKLYHEETGSDEVKTLFEDDAAENCICQLTFTEFCSTLYKKFRSKEITDERIIQEAIKSFEIDTQFEWTIQIDQNVFDEARTIIIKYGTQYAIRTLDALQLACAELISRTEETIFISSDEKQNAVTIEMGFRVIDPTTRNREPEL